MLELDGQPYDFETLDNIARHVRTGLIQPISLLTLEPILDEVVGSADPALYQECVNLTSLKAARMLRGDFTAYSNVNSEPSPPPDVSNLSFDPKLTNLPQYNTLPSETLAISADTVRSYIAKMLITANSYFSVHAYSQFFGSDQVTSQIEVVQLFKKLMDDLKANLTDPSLDLFIVAPENRKTGEIIDSIVTGNLLPTSIAASAMPSEFDSDEVNLMQVTSYGRGDKVLVLAEYGDYALVTTGDGYGWILKKLMRFEHEINIDTNTYLANYAGSDVFFFQNINGENDLLLPGDSIYVKDDIIYVLQRDNDTRQVRMHPIVHVSQLDINTTTLSVQQAINFLYSLDVPYIRGIFDCSEIYRRLFKMMGYNVGKYSGNIAGAINRALGSRREETITDFSKLSDGVYLSNIFDGSHSKHLSILIVEGGRVSIYSYTHDQEDSAYTKPHILGRHIVGIDAYLAKAGPHIITAIRLTI